ncbi:MAG: Monosaccharide-transporting ATPase [Deltaproteobacteria bacterium]|jgi:branched-chain amino acid transport system ATP-binding protein|nr:Monosaccharide-transporting ATPase [Deltaproteobacteria bacterium]
MTRESILTGANVSKYFGALRALDDVHFELYGGEILGIIGPNGAGKTTLLSVINGTLPITRGRIFFKEKEITGLKPFRIAELGISRTFQIVKPFPGMTALENVAIGALFGKEPEKKMPRAMEKAAEMIRKVALKDKENILVEKLNVSERKRLELARALTQDPEILLLDEVMAGLTPREIEDIMALIREVNRGGTTIMVIEHVMKAIMGISNRIIVLHHGQKIAEGTPNEISEDRQVIAAYLGERYSKRLEEASHAGD